MSRTNVLVAALALGLGALGCYYRAPITPRDLEGLHDGVRLELANGEHVTVTPATTIVVKRGTTPVMKGRLLGTTYDADADRLSLPAADGRSVWEPASAYDLEIEQLSAARTAGYTALGVGIAASVVATVLGTGFLLIAAAYAWGG